MSLVKEEVVEVVASVVVVAGGGVVAVVEGAGVDVTAIVVDEVKSKSSHFPLLQGQDLAVDNVGNGPSSNCRN